MTKVIGVLAAAALLTASANASAAPKNCGAFTSFGERLALNVTRGTVSCDVARRALRQFLPTRGRGKQSFRLARRRWFCADSHGRELMRGGVAHCVSGRVKILLQEPPRPVRPTRRAKSTPPVVAPTPAPAPAPVPSPQPTPPAPTPPAPPPVGSTRENPIPYGSTAAVGSWQIRVVSTRPNATAEVLAESRYNDPPRPDAQFFLALIQAERIGAGSASLYDWGFGVVGPSSVGYEAGCRFNDIPDALPSSEVFTGGSIAGNVCWEVAVAEANPLVMYTDLGFETDQRRFFSLTP